ncbi:hypothetical protein [Caldanaerobacter subterraneus]|uniref:Uncharacterized protein n=1 Tax=Caldanaerobacter subterraneus subsp. pacificus DSM 12653 TaxID=391606 RepID=A0A0F5PIU5_9THEO|nr:hypothetical protein [Caldanaerobacter subterraneus]KKC28567.1 hypothetical protein CDSM653_02445 [Caldanaerobacter subterraneus subsp. pacificus DSM 12653]
MLKAIGVAILGIVMAIGALAVGGLEKTVVKPESFSDSSDILVITKKYAFSKEKGDWKILYIDLGIYPGNISSDKIAFNTFERKPVKYTEKFNPLMGN